ncbi:MAG: hypothetical protein LV479_03655 [Methylacidiphilales bacterium]|nr:hypothetical protein [Candidatus Methylacidiphilales bacterium]
MKEIIKYIGLLTFLAFSFTSVLRAQDEPPPPPPDDQGQDQDQDASFQNFYDQLSDQGTWIQTDDYGYVFQPNVQDPNWAPYTDGHWVYTDAGWTWASDEPWGWATYHYGRWANIDGTGWVWVPGYEWAPAWVSWRYGGGYAGWAPLPPDTFAGAEYSDGGVNIGIGFHFGSDVDVSFGIGAGCYNFVQVGDLCRPDYRGRYIDRSRNYVVINNTTNVTNIVVNRNNFNGPNRFRGVTVGGPSLAEVNAHSATHFQTVHLTTSNRPGNAALQGNSLAVYAPHFNPATAHQARPATVAQTINHPTFNRGTSITKPLQVTANVHPAAPNPQAIQAAQAAQTHASAKAHIATDKTPVTHMLSKPLTSMQAATSKPSTPSGTGVNANAQVQHNEQVQHPETQHNAESSFTGEPPKPQVTHTQANPEINKPAETYHPETQGGGNFTPNENKTPAYHPQAETGGEPPTLHPSTEVQHQPQEQQHTESFHPNTGGGPGEGSTHAAPVNHPQSPSGPPGGGKPSGDNKGNKKPDDKKSDDKSHQ